MLVNAIRVGKMFSRAPAPDMVDYVAVKVVAQAKLHCASSQSERLGARDVQY